MRAIALLACLPGLGWGQLLFTDVTEAARVDVLQHVARARGDCMLYEGRHCEPERMSGGVAVGDFDGDGWPDLYLTRLDGEDTLLHNKGDGTFGDQTAQAGLDAPLQTNGALWVDIDNDHDLDLLLTTIGEDRYYLFVNDGGRFVEQAIDRGVAVLSDVPHGGFSAAAGDYDRDGWVDLFVTEWRIDATPDSPPHTRLLRNRGAAQPGHFDDVTAAAGVAFPRPRGGGHYAFAPAFVDLDDDEWPDLAVAADFGTSRLFWNNGDGTFTDGTLAAAVGTDEHGMGSTFGDFDGDGRLDWFVTSIYDPAEVCERESCNWLGDGNRLFRNLGERRFEDATDLGVRDGGWGWGAAFFDADNDADLDLVMTNGVRFPGFEADRSFNDDPMRFWRNDAGAFVERAAVVGLRDTGSGKGLAVFDYDQDGDLDVLIVRNASTPVFYRNDSPPGRWVEVSARGTRSNAQGLGARVRVIDGDRTQVAEIGSVSHFLGQSASARHFGLGASTWAQVEIRWPSGAQQAFPCVVSGTRLLAVEPAAGEDFAPPAPAAEACNGLDDDCDGAIDEGLAPRTCGVGRCARPLPGCLEGRVEVCDPLLGATPEVCNGEDDDCDGAVDEATGGEACRVGVGACLREAVTGCLDGRLACGATAADPAPETCDGVDEDCDGAIDEGLGERACGVGACARALPACVDGAAPACDPLRGATDEVCQGVDDDCDGRVDEGLGSQPCGVGVCAHRVPRCADGAPVACDPTRGARPERCDGFDDDCDGAVDEDWPELGAPCDGPDADECLDGVYECAGDRLRCVDLGGARAEVCGGGDEDCDGVIDEGCAGDAGPGPDATPDVAGALDTGARPPDGAAPDAAPDATISGEEEGSGCASTPAGPAWAPWWLALWAIRRRRRAHSTG